MRKILYAIFFILIAINSNANTLHWGNTKTTTCEFGNNFIVPTIEPAAAYGYHFAGWKRGLQQIEYLESTGTQYIDTGFKPTPKTSVQTEYQFLSRYGRVSNAQIGAGKSTDNFHRFVISADMIISLATSTTFTFINFNWFDKHVFKLDAKNYSASIDDVTLKTNTKTFVGSDSSFYLFNRNADNNAYIHPGRVYYLKLWDNDIIVRDIIPILDNNNIPCLYDKAENKFYYNSGTGNFIAGQIIGSTDNDTTIYNPGDIITNGCNNNDIYFYPIFEPNQHNCAPGYYLPANVDSCTICPQNGYCVGGIYSFNKTINQGIEQCENPAPFAPMGAAFCYEHILHIDNDVVYLKSTKLTTPSLNVGFGDNVFYANMTTVPTRMNATTQRYLKIEYDGTVYYVCDDTTYGKESHPSTE